ncbi:VWA domain-containing protein [Plantactinospora sp. GCM10030261]|uniref:VWA domain-containing protein n=1 Tax=Plantactinospora sp. GCM10030261 TaxID=3273420 RepID=UPI00361391C0
MSGRHRNRRRVRGAGATAAAVALVLVVGGAWFGYKRLAQPACSGEVRLTVGAAPEIAPAVQSVADGWARKGAAVEGVCVTVAVEASQPVDVAAVVAGQHGVSLSGVGQAPGTAVAPDVWIPDSSTWLLRLQSQAPGFAPANRASVARSPVVVAVPEPVATTIGWPDKKLTWTSLLEQVTKGTKLRTGIVEPTRDAAGLSGLLSLSAAAGASPDAQKDTTAALRALAAGRSQLRDDLLARFPRSAEPSAIAVSVSAAALSEEDVIAFNAKKPPIPLAALYVEPAPLSLDYPYAVLPGIQAAQAKAAEGLYNVLNNTAGFRDQLGAQGLRAADGTFTPGLAAPQGAPSPAGTESASSTPDSGGSAAAGLDLTALNRALSAWSIRTQPGRLLAVLDVSGSMAEKVPGGSATREQVTVAAAARGLELFDDTWQVGLWTFATDLVGPQEWRELVPIGPLSTDRTRLQAALRTVVPKENGDTGLFDTMLAAYKNVRDGWEPGRVNSIVLFTDGRNENDEGISQQRMLADLKKLADPDRPVQVVIIGIGQDVNQEELRSIVKVTGGGVFVTEDPARIPDIFLQAIALRAPTTR